MASGTIPKYADGTDTGWNTVTPTQDNGVPRYSGTIKYRRIGNIFEVKNTAWIKLATDLPAGGSRALGTIPSGDRPSGAVVGYAYLNSSPYPLFAVRLETNLSIYNGSGSTIPANTNMIIHIITFFE